MIDNAFCDVILFADGVCSEQDSECYTSYHILLSWFSMREATIILYNSNASSDNGMLIIKHVYDYCVGVFAPYNTQFGGKKWLLQQYWQYSPPNSRCGLPTQ